MLHSRNRPRPVVHQQHQTVFCSSMPEQQPTHHRCSACVAYGVQNCGYTLQTIAVEVEDRTCAGVTLQGAGCDPVKRLMSPDGVRSREVYPQKH